MAEQTQSSVSKSKYLLIVLGANTHTVDKFNVAKYLQKQKYRVTIQLVMNLHMISKQKFHLAWPGLAWPGLAWPGLAWPGLAWHSLARPKQNFCFGVNGRFITRVRLVLDKNCWVCRKWLLHSTVAASKQARNRNGDEANPVTVVCSKHFLHTQQFLSRAKRTLFVTS